ncbi:MULTISPECIES: RidA family protein [Paenalcaligenes]|uniref:RidA family protein n=1 Tax=Paenalcaligenes hermetiae TaxID=1157987 RepID=A0ABP9LWU4_9BURK|nr:RidA family protein [Paenalcaligenes sp.]
MLMRTTLKTVGLVAGALLAFSVQAQEIQRVPAPNDFPIATSVSIPAGAQLHYLSGVVPSKDAQGHYGDTEAQTISVLKTIESNLKALGLGMGDVVKMQVYLVADPNKDNKMDFEGFMKGYQQFFGTKDQPNLPARSAMQVAGLVMPEWLIEIEVVAASK